MTIDPHSATWQAIAAWAQQRQDQATADLIQGGATPGHDDKRRGEIRALDELLALADAPATPPIPPITY